MSVSEQLKSLHDPYFDEHVQRAHEFTDRQLGLHTVGTHRVAVIGSEDHDRARNLTTASKSIRGGYNHEVGGIVLFAEGDKDNPEGATARLESEIVHELTHSGSANLSEHTFYNEALAGIAEARYLQWLKANGRWQPALDFTLRRAGVELVVPGNFRYYDRSDTSNANSSQGLIAGLGMAYGLRESGTKVADIMGASSINGHKQFDVMKQSLDSIKPGLAREVETFPQSTDGIIQATAVIQDTVLSQGEDK